MFQWLFIDLISPSILFFISSTSTIVLVYAVVLIEPYKKKSRAIRPEDRDVQETEPPLSIHLPLKFSSNHGRTSFETCDGAPFC